MRSSLAILVSGGGLALVRLVAGVARSKWIATRFGLEGVGLLAQATQFQLLAVSAASLSVTSALIQGARGPFRDSGERLFQTAFLLILVGCTALTILALGVGLHDMSAWLFGEGHSAWDFLLLLASVPFVLVASAFTEAAYFVHDRFDRYSFSSALHAIAQPIVFIAMTLSFGLRGILLAFPVMAFLLAALFLTDLYRLGILRKSWFRPRWNPEMAKFLAGHGTAMFITGVGGGFLLLFVRSTLVARLGLAENGVLQVPIALSSYGGALVTNFIWGRIHPSCSAELGTKEERDISFAILSAFLVTLGTWASAPLFIPLVYSKAFIAAVPLIGLQATGDIFYYAFLTLAVVLLATGRIFLYVAAWAAFYAPYLAALFLPSLLDVRSITTLHLAASCLAFLLLSAFAASKDLMPLAMLRRLSLAATALGLLLGATALGGPDQWTARIALGAITGSAGIFLWKLIYGELANMEELKTLARNLLRITRLDSVLAQLLRFGFLPKALEKLAPQYRDYPVPTLRRVRREGLVADLELTDLPDWKAYYRKHDKKRARMYSLVPPGATMLEVGCARGWVALKLAQRIGEKGRLLAVDAHAPSAQETKRRLELNGFHWASARAIAFSDREGSVTISPEADRNSASVSVSISSEGVPTRAARLDDWLREESLPDFEVLKVSVNGWETHAFKGALEFLRRKRPLIFTEVGDFNLRRAGSSPAELLAIFADLGYRLETTWGPSEIPTGDDLNGCLFDVVAFPSER